MRIRIRTYSDFALIRVVHCSIADSLYVYMCVCSRLLVFIGVCDFCVSVCVRVWMCFTFH